MLMDGNGNQPVKIVNCYNDEDSYYKDYEVDDKVFAPRLDAPLQLDAIKLIGGAASHVIGTRREPYNDVDITFEMAISGARDFNRIRVAVASAVLQMMPPETNRTRLTPAIINEAYVEKMLVVDNNGGDRWSLISLGVQTQRNGYSSRETVELKFVDRMDRPYQFTVDSFQIKLDEMLGFYLSEDYGLVGSGRCSDCYAKTRKRDDDESDSDFSSNGRSLSSGIESLGDKRKKLRSIENQKSRAVDSKSDNSRAGNSVKGDSDKGNSGKGDSGKGNSEGRNSRGEKKIVGRMIVYPAVVAESTFGDYRMAVSHLEGRWIVTNSPEMIRGGGLLAYCNLLRRGYRIPPVPNNYWAEQEYLDEYYEEDYAGRLRFCIEVEGSLDSTAVVAASAPYERAACFRFYQDFHSYSAERLLTIVANYLLSHMGTAQDLLAQSEYLHILRKIVFRNGHYCPMQRSLMLSTVDMMAYQVTNGEWQNAYQIRKQLKRRPYRQNWPARGLYELAGIPPWLEHQSVRWMCDLRAWKKQQFLLIQHCHEHRYRRETFIGIQFISQLRPLKSKFEKDSEIDMFLNLKLKKEQLHRLQIKLWFI